MATEALIAWTAPDHLYTEKRPDWYWAVGIITLALAAVAFILGDVVSGIFVVVAAAALVIHASEPARTIACEINDRGVMIDSVLHPFVALDSFWIPHDEFPPKIILKSRKMFMPLLAIYIQDVDPEEVRAVMVKYIAETEHHEPLLKHLFERLGF